MNYPSAISTSTPVVILPEKLVRITTPSGTPTIQPVKKSQAAFTKTRPHKKWRKSTEFYCNQLVSQNILIWNYCIVTCILQSHMLILTFQMIDNYQMISLVDEFGLWWHTLDDRIFMNKPASYMVILDLKVCLFASRHSILCRLVVVVVMMGVCGWIGGGAVMLHQSFTRENANLTR